MELVVIDDLLYINDRNSANGSELVRGGDQTLVTPGDWVELVRGDVVVIGDQSVTIV